MTLATIEYTDAKPYSRAFSFWTEEDIVLLRAMARQEYTLPEIAGAMFRTEAGVREKARELRVRIFRTKRSPPMVDLDGLDRVNNWERGSFVLGRVSDAYSMRPAEIASKSRKAHIVEARQHAVYLIAKHTKLSFPQIGRLLGGRDHTTILYSLQVMNQRRGDNVRGSGPIPVSKVLGWQRYKDSVRSRRAA